MTREELWEKYKNRWRDKKTDTDEYVLSCTDPDEIHALWEFWAPLDDGYWEHNYGAICCVRLKQLKAQGAIEES